MSNKKLNRYFVLSPSTFKKLSESSINQNKLSDLDKSIFHILSNQSLTDIKKWELYSQELLKFNHKMRAGSSMKKNLPHSEGRVLNKENPVPQVSQETQTTPTLRKNMINQFLKPTSHLFTSYRDNSKPVLSPSSNESSPNFNHLHTNPDFEEMFTSENDANLSAPALTDNEDDELEQTLFFLAKSKLKEPNEANILRRDETLNEAYRVFENRKTMDLIAIEVEPVSDYIYSNTPLDFEEEVAERTDAPVSTSKARKKLDFNHAPIDNQSSDIVPKYIVLRNRNVKRRRSSSLSKIKYSHPPHSKRIKQAGDAKKKNNLEQINWSPL